MPTQAAPPAKPVRPAAAADVPALLALEQSCFEPYRRHTADQLRALVVAGKAWTVEGKNGRLGGFVLATIDPTRASVEALAAHPEARGEGLGSRLLKAIEDVTRTTGAVFIQAHAEEADPDLLAWYAAKGYNRRERVADHFHAGCHAIRFEKIL